MPLDFAIPQLLVVSDRSGPTAVAKSDGLPFAVEDAALRAAARFGPRPAGVTVPAALFVTPHARSHVFVVRVTDVPGPDAPLAFHFLALNRPLYEALGDPFAIAERFAPEWASRGGLPVLTWPGEPLPPRRLEDITALFKAGDGPLLLGATQSLLDGGRLMLKRDSPDDVVLRAIWQLLPTRTRCDLWPATFAFSNALGFHVVALPEVPEKLPLGYLSEEQVKDYPEGRYELALQAASEGGNQADLDRLLARASSRDMLRLATMMVLGAIGIAAVAKFLR
jgi:hypothetical protein